jgi:hypothetical protein
MAGWLLSLLVHTGESSLVSNAYFQRGDSAFLETPVYAVNEFGTFVGGEYRGAGEQSKNQFKTVEVGAGCLLGLRTPPRIV